MQSTRAFNRTALPQRAFSRTDLLIVLGVLVLIGLIALSFPLMARAKEKAKRDQCANNQRQIGNALTLYFQDGNEKFPKEWKNFKHMPLSRPDPESPTGHYCEQGFEAVLEQFLPNRALFACPSDTALKSNVVVGYHNPKRNRWDDTSYGLNIFLNGKSRDIASDPANTIFAAHTRFEHVIWEDQHSALFDTHLKGNNYVFTDGHVQWLTREQTYKPKNLWKP